RDLSRGGRSSAACAAQLAGVRAAADASWSGAETSSDPPISLEGTGMKTIVAAGIILAAFALPAFAGTGTSASTGTSPSTGSGAGYLLSVGGGVPLPVGDYNSQVNPSFSIPVELNAALKHHIGWTAVYAFNRLTPSDETKAQSASEGKVSQDSDVN